MGTVKNDSLLNGASGRIDDLVFYTVDGKTYFRRNCKTPANPKTPRQTLQRNRIVSAQTFFQSVKKCILYDVLNISARRQKLRSGYHLFLKLNTNAFGEEEYIDYSLMTFAQGGLQLPYDFQLHTEADEQIWLTWTDNPEQSTAGEADRLLVAAVLPDEPFRVVMLEGINAVRGDGRAELPLPTTAKGAVHLYCFFAQCGGRAFSCDRYFCVTL